MGATAAIASAPDLANIAGTVLQASTARQQGGSMRGKYGDTTGVFHTRKAFLRTFDANDFPDPALSLPPWKK
jgi:hypothetical protein